MALGKNIERLRKAKNMTLRVVADAAGTDPQAIKALETRDSTSSKYAPALAKLFGISIEILMQDNADLAVFSSAENAAPKLPLIPEDELNSDPVHDIEVWHIAKEMGYTLRSTVNSRTVAHIKVSAQALQSLSLSTFENLKFMAAFGDSMESTFFDGDALIVDTGETELKTDAIYVILIAGVLFVKRFQRRPGGDTLMISDNKKYEPHVMKSDAPHPFTVLGRVLIALPGASLDL